METVIIIFVGRMVVTIIQTKGNDMNNWLPINTAPRNGEKILVSNGYDVLSVCWARREMQWWICGAINGMTTRPTHWMPTPPLPNVETARREESERSAGCLVDQEEPRR
jgi:hypothetical protein